MAAAKDSNDELLPTRASLLGRLQDWQNDQSWKEFFDSYWRLIYGVARKAGLSDSEAQDVVQEVLIHVAKQMPTFRYDPAVGSFKGWLLTKTRWCVISQMRQRGRHPLAEPRADGEDGQQPEDTGNAVDKMWDAEWRQNMFEAALTRLKRKFDPLKLQIWEFYVRKEIAAEEVASRFNVTVEHVYLIKHRVNEALKAEIEQLGEA